MSWQTVPLKRVASLRVSNVDKKSVEGDPPVRLCNYTDVYYRDSINPAQDFMKATASLEQIAAFRLKTGDIVITKDSEAADDIGVPTFVEASASDLVCGYHLALIRPLNKIVSGRFLFWAMASSAMRSQLEAAATGITRFGLRTDAISNATLTLPLLSAQRAIADFLDAETARIDALIAKKRRLTSLLLTRVESLVSERLRQIERQRGFVPLKSVANIKVSNVDKKTAEGEQTVRLCNYTDVYYSRRIDPEADFMLASATQEQIRDFELRSGDVLITKDSETADDIGIPAYVPDDMPGVILGYHTALLRPRHVDGQYVYWVLRSRRSRDHFTLTASGVTRFGLRQGDIGSLPVPAATLAEQNLISREIEKSVTSGESTMNALERQITLLAEHRQALITAAVTGEIEVPGARAR